VTSSAKNAASAAAPAPASSSSVLMVSSSITQNDIIKIHQTIHDPARRAIARSR
jgi:hypothetical protein